MGDGDFTIINIREFHYNLVAFQDENELWGFMDREGKIVSLNKVMLKELKKALMKK